MKTINQIVLAAGGERASSCAPVFPFEERLVRAAIAACAEETRATAAKHLAVADRFERTLGFGDDLGGSVAREVDIAEILEALAARLEGAAGAASHLWPPTGPGSASEATMRPLSAEPAPSGAVPAPEKIRAPWTAEQVELLNLHQKTRTLHPYTCADGCGDLVAIKEGLWCPECEYLQSWAWAASLELAAKSRERTEAAALALGASPDPRDWPGVVPTDPRPYFAAHPPTEAEIAHGQALEKDEPQKGATNEDDA